MTKYIVSALKPEDIIGLMVDTKKTLSRPIVWSVKDIVEVGETDVEEWLVDYELYEGHLSEVDNLIMGPEVPTGAMVVLCDGRDEPCYGFVCGNGNSWHRVELPVYLKEKFVTPKTYGVNLGSKRNRKMRWFDSKKELVTWVKMGIAACDGSEQDRYFGMLGQLSGGEKILIYDNY